MIEDNSMFKGHLDSLRYNFEQGWILQGWAINNESANIPVDVELFLEDRSLGLGVASIFRADLERIGGGFHAFAFTLPPNVVLNQGPTNFTVRASLGGRYANFHRQFCASPIIGWVDGQQGIVVGGWACNVFDREAPLVLDIILDDEVVDRVRADQARADLRKFDLGDCGFSWIMKEEFIDSLPRRLSVRVSNGLNIVPGSSIDISASPNSLTQDMRHLLYLSKHAMSACANNPPASLADSSPENLRSSSTAMQLPQAAVWGYGLEDIVKSKLSLSKCDLQVLYGEDARAHGENSQIDYIDAPTIGRIMDLGSGKIKLIYGARDEIHSFCIDIMIDNRAVAIMSSDHAENVFEENGLNWSEFSWHVPRRYFDGFRHVISARLSNTSAIFRGAVLFAALPNESRDGRLLSSRGTEQTVADIRATVIDLGRTLSHAPPSSPIDLILDR